MFWTRVSTLWVRLSLTAADLGVLGFFQVDFCRPVPGLPPLPAVQEYEQAVGRGPVHDHVPVRVFGEFRIWDGHPHEGQQLVRAAGLGLGGGWGRGGEGERKPQVWWGWGGSIA